MKWGWVLITLYMGPIAAGPLRPHRQGAPPRRARGFIRPLWKQGIGSTVHCIAGDATGIIAAAVITAALGLPMWVDLIVEYVAGFAFGLFIFQALFMKDMMGGSYRAALRGAFMPEWLSMNMMAAGMFPVMILLMMGRDMRAMDPADTPVLGRHVPRRDRRLLRRLPGQRVDGREEPQARPDDRPARLRHAGRESPRPLSRPPAEALS